MSTIFKIVVRHLVLRMMKRMDDLEKCEQYPGTEADVSVEQQFQD